MRLLIKEMIIVFSMVSAGTLFSMALLMTLFSAEKTIATAELWRILAVGLLSAIGSLILYSRKEPTPKAMLIRHLLHALYIAVLMLVLGISWNWLIPGRPAQNAAFIVLVLGVYAAVISYTFWEEKKTADALNKQLKKDHK